MASSKELMYGRAGEHLVIVDLIKKGFEPFLTGRNANYDIILPILNGDVRDGSKLLRVQVKTTSKPGKMNSEYFTPVYIFHVRRAGKGSKRLYQVGEFDMFAFAMLDTMSVSYMLFTKEVNKTVILRDRRQNYKVNTGRIAPYADDLTIERCVSSFHGGD